MSVGAVTLGEVSRVARSHSIEEAPIPAEPGQQAIAAVLAHLAASIIGNEASQTHSTRDNRVEWVGSPKGSNNGGIERHHVAHSAHPEECRRGSRLADLGAPTNVSEARMDYDLARDSRRRAQEELQAAIKSGDPERIRAAQSKLRVAVKAEAAALETYNRTVLEADIEKKRLTKEGTDRIARAVQNQAAEQHRFADSKSDSMAPAHLAIGAQVAGTVIKTAGGAKQRLLNADSEVSAAHFQLVNNLRNAD